MQTTLITWHYHRFRFVIYSFIKVQKENMYLKLHLTNNNHKIFRYQKHIYFFIQVFYLESQNKFLE